MGDTVSKRQIKNANFIGETNVNFLMPLRNLNYDLPIYSNSI
jgi:hypothetical protein